MGFSVHLLSDGISYWDGGGAFGLVPRTKWIKILPPDEENRVPQALRCVLVQAGGQNILVDCGVGDKPNEVIAAQYDVRRPNGNLLDDLARLGLTAADIHTVVFTHLHGDHAGWATRLAGDPPVCIPTFPNARYYVQRQEYHDATHTNERTRNTYFPDNYVALTEAGVLTLLDGEAEIAPQVRVAPTPGHTAGHQSVLIEASPHWQNEALKSAPALILGDMATYMIQFARLPWVTAYDVLPLVNIETKRAWQAWAYSHGALLISPHDTQTPVGRLTKTDKGFFTVDPATL
ncbi:MAG: MBL fold metallo-hydrolase [Anaerolineae bacterium]|nr:MBL fold metallo-hydrolase [Thermoflexales bacterium]MDW8407233.1 MBL fold metallo-hydrolase [Anaerolineae bacterium]